MKVGTLLKLGLGDVAGRGAAMTALYAGATGDPMAVLRPSYDDVAVQAKALEAAGFDTVFTIESSHDVFLPLALAASATDLQVMTNVALAFPRSPLHLAHQAYDLQLISRGRFALGLGSQVKPVIERAFSAPWSHPVERMREMVLATKAILACWQGGGPLDFEGRFYRHTFMNAAFSPGPNPHGIPPILVGALGPRMTQMTAEVADGLLLHPFCSELFVRERVLPAVHTGLAAAGRDRGSFSFVGNVLVVTGRNDGEVEAAEAGVRALVAFYGSTPTYRPLMELEGRLDLHLELNRLSKDGRWADMAARIDDDVLDTFAVRARPGDVAKAIAARYGEVADRINLYLPYPTDIGLLAGCAAGFGSHE